MTQQHYDRFMQLVAARWSTPIPIEQVDLEYASAFYLLSCKQSIFDLVSKYVSQEGIAFNKIIKMEAYGYEQSHRGLMRLAANLFFSSAVKGLDITDIQGQIIGFALRAIQLRMLGDRSVLKVDG